MDLSPFLIAVGGLGIEPDALADICKGSREIALGGVGDPSVVEGRGPSTLCPAGYDARAGRDAEIRLLAGEAAGLQVLS
jgi:hypothetical protein